MTQSQIAASLRHQEEDYTKDKHTKKTTTKSAEYSFMSVCFYCNKYEPGHEKMCLMSYVNNKGADQISAFVFRCLDSIISLDSIVKISRPQLASMAAQAGLCLAWSETPEDTFCHVVAHNH